MVQTGGAGGQTSVFIRGTNSNHVKVQIDGIDVNDPSTPNRSFDFSQLQTEDLSRIEVLRGPQSGLYGADAIGGVISFVTKRGEGPPKVTAFAEGGSYGTFNQGGRLSGAQGIFDYSFSVQHLRQAALPVTPFELLPPACPCVPPSPTSRPSRPSSARNSPTPSASTTSCASPTAPISTKPTAASRTRRPPTATSMTSSNS